MIIPIIARMCIHWHTLARAYTHIRDPEVPVRLVLAHPVPHHLCFATVRLCVWYSTAWSKSPSELYVIPKPPHAFSPG